MIPKEELRIGNYVIPIKDNFYGEYKDKPCQVESITYKGINDWQDMGMSGRLEYSEINPIPLTEQWLLDLGFVSDGIKNEWWFNGHVQLGYITTDANYEFEYHRKALPTQLKYVHQLQNLFWCLCGVELKLH